MTTLLSQAWGAFQCSYGPVLYGVCRRQHGRGAKGQRQRLWTERRLSHSQIVKTRFLGGFWNKQCKPLISKIQTSADTPFPKTMKRGALKVAGQSQPRGVNPDPRISQLCCPHEAQSQSLVQSLGAQNWPHSWGSISEGFAVVFTPAR